MTTLEKWETVKKLPATQETYPLYMEAFLLMIYEGKKSNVVRFHNTTFEINVDVLETNE